jgi:hypothetical protein
MVDTDEVQTDVQKLLSAIAAAVRTHSPINQDLLLALIKGLDEKIGLLINAQKEGVKIAMDASAEAIKKAEIAADKRFEALNELRGMASDWRAEFARQVTVDLQIEGMHDKIDLQRTTLTELDKRVGEMIARGSGRQDVWAWLMAGLVAGGTIGALLAPHLGH